MSRSTPTASWCRPSRSRTPTPVPERTAANGGTPDGGGTDAGTNDAGPILNDAGVALVTQGAIAIPDGGTIPFPQDAGFVAADFDARGNVLFTRTQRTGSDVIALGEPINGPRPATGYSVPFLLDSLQADGSVTGPPLTRMDDLVCPPDELTGAQNGCYFGAATHQVSCLQAATGTVFSAVGSSSTLPLAPPVPGGTAGAFNAVRTYLSPNDASTTCGPAWTFFAFPKNGFVPQLRTDSAFAGCAVQSVNRLLPLLDGGYAVGVTLDCGVVAANIRYVVLRVDPTGAITGSYLAKVGVTLAAQPLVLAALQGGTFPGAVPALGAVVTMRNDPPYTTFEAWSPDGAGPIATARIPGLYLYSRGHRPARKERALGVERELHRSLEQRCARRRGGPVRAGAHAALALPLPAHRPELRAHRGRERRHGLLRRPVQQRHRGAQAVLRPRRRELSLTPSGRPRRPGSWLSSAS